MSKHRIYEIAKEFGTESKVVLDILKKHNIEVKSAVNTVDDAGRSIVQKALQKKSAPAAAKKTDTGREPAVKNERPRGNRNLSNNRINRHGNNTNDSLNKPRILNNNGNSTGSHNDRNNNAHKIQHDKRQSYNKGNGNIKTAVRNTANRQHENNSKINMRNRTNKPGERPHQQSGQQNGRHPGQPNHQQHNRNAANISQHPQQRNAVKTRPANANTDSSHKNIRNDNKSVNKNNNTQGSKNTQNSRNPQNNNRPFQNNNRHNHHDQNGGHNRNNRKWRNRNNRNHQMQQKQEIIRPKVIKVGETIAIKELASKMTYTVTDIIKKLMMLGIMATINQEIDFDTAVLVAAEFNINVEELPPEVDLTEIPEIEDDEKDLLPRPPVVTVMGHVDHGKTSLLDVIRKTSVTSSEAGGITQHIGAYQVMCKDKKIVFLDTPGHEAFTAMRARGAQVTDIAVLVVAADDGVMPQTLEAINHAKAAKVPIVVAINKIDKPGANPEHVKQQLSEHELVAEDWGGDTIMVPVSAKKKLGINDLLEMILLVAEMQELKANPNRDARGIIIEAQLDKGRGPVATVLIQNGTLHVGDSIIAGTAYGKVRAMINDRGEKVKKAGPSMPVEVLGLSDVPDAGDEMAALDEHLARTIAEKRIGKQRTELINTKKVSLDDLFEQINEGNIKDLNILLKTDVQGSLEALKTSLLALNKNDEVRVSIIHSGVGAVNESDVMLASAANALILAFNVRPDANARKLADTEKIDIRTYRVIYEAINDIKAAMKGMLAPKYKESIQGKVEIRKVMKFSKVLVAGSYVLEGKITNTSKIRILRDNVVVHEGQIESLRRFKDDVKEVTAGYECGITIENYRDFKENDIIEAYTMEEIAPQSL